MSRETRINRTVRRAIERQLTKAKVTTIIPQRKTLRTFVFLIGIPSFLAALLALWPRMTPAISEPVDPADPFSSSVTIANTGYIPLDDVSPLLGAGIICTTRLDCVPEKDTPQRDYRIKLRRARWISHHLAVDDRFTFVLSDVIEVKPNDLTYADVGIVVEYRLPIVRWKMEKTFPVVSRRQKNGKYIWYWK